MGLEKEFSDTVDTATVGEIKYGLEVGDLSDVVRGML